MAVEAFTTDSALSSTDLTSETQGGQESEGKGIKVRTDLACLFSRSYCDTAEIFQLKIQGINSRFICSHVLVLFHFRHSFEHKLPRVVSEQFASVLL